MYVQIARNLATRIESGELKPGDQLPPERELSRQLGVTRMTAREALKLLELQGLINRRQGAGTFIAHPKVERHANQLVPFTRGMRRRGYLPGGKVLTSEQQVATAIIAPLLQILEGEPIYFIRRLRLLNHAPVMLERLTLPAQHVPDLPQFNLSERSLYEVLETEYNITVVRAWQAFEAVSATAYEADLLNLTEGAALMLEERVAYDQHGRPIEYGKDVYRGDRFRFVTESAPME